METLDSKQVYASPWMTVREDEVRRADGSTGRYSVVDGPDLALVIPAQDDRLHLVEQYRYPVGGRRWEFPSGNIDAADPEAGAAALRELREETGLLAGDVTPLGTLDVAPGTSSHRCWVFVATQLTAGEPARDLEEQDLRSQWFTRAELRRMISDGEMTDAKSIAAYTLWALQQ